MSRREFVHHGAAGGLALMAGGAAPRTARAAEFAPGSPPQASFELEEATIERLQEGMSSGEYTARSLAERYLERIEELDRKGPALRHMLDLDPDVLAIAGALDDERRSGRIRGPLHGIPVLLKDNIDTAGCMATTAGSLALEGSTAPRDAFLTRKLREAGTVILGKTNLSEWANFRSTRSSSGWSGRGGQGKNPYALDRSPCGSSSGSAAAIAANFATVAVGTETDGSIVCPSSANCVVGIKPTLGLVSRSGVVPIAHSQDTAGPVARTVADAAILLGALAGEDPEDAATRAVRGRTQPDYTAFLDPAGLRGARRGAPRAVLRVQRGGGPHRRRGHLDDAEPRGADRRSGGHPERR